jgi:hypothetical protein
VHRPGRDAPHGPKGRRQLSGELADQLHLLGEVGGRPKVATVACPLHAAVLKGATALQGCGDVPGNEQHARTVRPRRDGRRQDISSPRAADTETSAEPAADSRVPVSHEPGPLLMRRHNRLRPDPRAQLSDQRVDMPARHQENMAQSLVAQTTQQELRTGHHKPFGWRKRKSLRPSERYTAFPNPCAVIRSRWAMVQRQAEHSATRRLRGLSCVTDISAPIFRQRAQARID